jgi:hypothetical protein
MPTIGVTGDGSISGSNGVEFVTPILAKKAGEEYIKKLCKLLKDGAVNQSCGLHVHLTADDLKRKMQTLWRFYTAFDNVILSFLPSSRRTNRYCQPISKLFSTADIQKNYDTGLEALWYKIPTGGRSTEFISELERCKSEHKHQSRYCGVNFHTMITEGHLEIRYHSATLSAKKILFWVKLHQAILDTVGESRNIGEAISKAENMLSVVEKTNFLFDTLKLDNEMKAYYKERQEKFNAFREVATATASENESDLVESNPSTTCAV